MMLELALRGDPRDLDLEPLMMALEVLANLLDGDYFALRDAFSASRSALLGLQSQFARRFLDCARHGLVLERAVVLALLQNAGDSPPIQAKPARDGRNARSGSIQSQNLLDAGRRDPWGRLWKRHFV